MYVRTYGYIFIYMSRNKTNTSTVPLIVYYCFDYFFEMRIICIIYDEFEKIITVRSDVSGYTYV